MREIKSEARRFGRESVVQDTWSNPVVIFLLGLVAAMVGGWAKDRVEEFSKRSDRIEDRVEHRADKQSTQGETLAGAVARIAALEVATAQIADAVQRIARVEEWRSIVAPKLEEVDLIGRAVAAMTEQIRTLFNRLDSLPRDTADQLMARIKARPA